ncbi:MAG: transcriptional repressor [Opitutae bacterium]|nr:transcriptional repressor [Opitutae bacterium]MCD8298235.1 transcriptional repressor [Opitutae bacterium]
MKTAQYSELLRERGIRPSLQRLAIYEYLLKSYNHPTAEDVYRALVPKISTLSRTTVYNTLRLFSDKGAILTITIEEKEMRFDAHLAPHGHFKCTECGKITDFPVEDAEAMCKNVPAGSEIRGAQVYVFGVCAECKSHRN